MKRQEQIEKMARLICEDDIPYGDEEDKIKCKDCCCYKNKHCTLYQNEATNFVNAGYINDADFVEWLKNSRFVKPYMDDVDYCMGVDVEKFTEALQEYLKDE